jgi:cysteine protease ATG4
VWYLLQLGRNHKPIFTIQDEPPTWPSDTDEFMGLESISEPDDMDMDDDDDDEAQDDGVDEPFFDTRDGTRSPSTSPDASVRGGARSSDFDTEEDPMGPDTPGQTPRTTFEVGKGGLPEAFDDKRREDVDVGDQDDDDDDDDDWVDPSVTTSPPPPPKIQAPAMVQTHSNSSSSSSSSGVKVKSSKSKKTVKRKSASVVPVLRTPEPSAHFPFPSSVEDTTTPQQEDFQQQRDQLPEMQENGKKLQRMHTARARDGGRTQSGGVKGVLTAEDGGENF